MQLSVNPLPAGWGESVDPSSGNVFYHCAATGETTWTRPAAQTLPSALPDGWAEHSDPSSGKAFYHNATTGETSWTRPSVKSQPNTTTASPLPAGWTEHSDPSSGKTFYFYASTGETSWTRPGAQDQTNSALPQGWTEHKDPGSGNYFYCCATTGETTWTRPVTKAQVAQPLPDGWTEHSDPGSGKPFFYCAATGSTSWTRPGSWPKTLYLVRHGESTYNSAEVDTMNKTWDPRLSRNGELQGRSLQDQLSALAPIPLVLMSPLSRAVQTCILAMPQHLHSKTSYEANSLLTDLVTAPCDIGRPPVELQADFPEPNFSSLQEVWWYVPEEHRTGITAAWSYEILRHVGCHEPKNSVVDRVDRFAGMLADRQEDKIVIFGHGDYFNILLQRHFARQGATFSDYWMENCEVLTLTVNGPEELRSPQEKKPKPEEPPDQQVLQAPVQSAPSRATLGMNALKREIAAQHPELRPPQVMQRAAAAWKTFDAVTRERYMAM